MYLHVYIQFSLALYKQKHNLYISVCTSERGKGETGERDLGEWRARSGRGESGERKYMYIYNFHAFYTFAFV